MWVSSESICFFRLRSDEVMRGKLHWPQPESIMSGFFNALKILNILSFTKHRSKQVWITERINISLVLLVKNSNHLHLIQITNNEKITIDCLHQHRI